MFTKEISTYTQSDGRPASVSANSTLASSFILGVSGEALGNQILKILQTKLKIEDGICKITFGNKV